MKSQILNRDALGAAILGVLLFSHATEAASPADHRVENGRAIAVAHCSECHAVDRGDESPTRANSETALRDLHRRFPVRMLVEAAQSGLIAGHDEMPEFVFSRSEIGDLLAYIDSLSPENSGKYAVPEQ